MRVLLAGGVFRKSPEGIAAQQPTPEIVLTAGLREAGIFVENVPLEDRWTIARARSYDVVHVHHLSRAAVAAAMFPRRSPMVFTAHSAAVPPTRRQRLGLSVVTHCMAAGVCLSDAEAELRSGWFPSARERMIVIPNGIALPNEAVIPRALANEDVRVLFVGQLADVKRVHLIIEALVQHEHLTLRLVYHNDQLESSLRALAAELGVANRVTFVGRRSGVELFDEYRAAHVLLLPSRSEALPSVVTEALSTGLPVIASDVGGVRGQVQSAGILIDTDDTSAVERALRRLTESYATYSSLAAERAGQVRREFSVDDMVQRHVSLYEDVVKKVKR